jgi:alpha-D-ribose 1-methylphosphonate 5-triphosphate synthase subunit PhnH
MRESERSPMLTPPPYTASEAQARETFLAMMHALSRPGTIMALPATDGGPLAAIGEALLDLETSFHTPDAALGERLARTGALAQPASHANYLFFPALDVAALEAMRAARIGSALRPDESATIIVGCAFAAGARFRWAGPGIPGERQVWLGGVHNGLWPLRASARYPLGWDIFFVDGARVIGLPRTTQTTRLD